MAKKRKRTVDQISNDLESYDLYLRYGVDVLGRKLMISSDVEEEHIGVKIRGLQLMEEISSEPIDIYISSFGGSVYDGFSIIDAIDISKCKIRTHAQGKVMSMGYIIFLSGNERYAGKRITVMAHSISSVSIGKTFELQAEVDECKRLGNVTLDLLEERTSKSRTWWKKELKYKDNYYNFKRAKELGIITNEYR